MGLALCFGRLVLSFAKITLHPIPGDPGYDQRGWRRAIPQANPDRLVKVDVLLIEHEVIHPHRQIKKSSIYVHVTYGEADRPYAVEVVGWCEREPVVVSLGVHLKANHLMAVTCNGSNSFTPRRRRLALWNRPAFGCRLPCIPDSSLRFGG